MHLLGRGCWGRVESATNVVGCPIVASDQLPAGHEGATVARRVVMINLDETSQESVP